MEIIDGSEKLNAEDSRSTQFPTTLNIPGTQIPSFNAPVPSAVGPVPLPPGCECRNFITQFHLCVLCLFIFEITPTY